MTIQIYPQAAHSELFYDFDDPRGEENFIMWHHMRHRTYDLILSKAGTTLPPLDLTGAIDSDWLLRHANRHTTLRKIAGTVVLNGTVGLKTVSWENQSQRIDWLRIHAIDHQNLDAYFGLT